MNALLLFLGGVGFQEIMLIGVFILIFFGTKRIPEFMKSLGKGIREFKDVMGNVKKEVEDVKNDIPKIDIKL
jgi:sec-independent protein translocase protein TatA